MREIHSNLQYLKSWSPILARRTWLGRRDAKIGRGVRKNPVKNKNYIVSLNFYCVKKIPPRKKKNLQKLSISAKGTSSHYCKLESDNWTGLRRATGLASLRRRPRDLQKRRLRRAAPYAPPPPGPTARRRFRPNSPLALQNGGGGGQNGPEAARRRRWRCWSVMEGEARLMERSVLSSSSAYAGLYLTAPSASVYRKDGFRSQTPELSRD
ncbi:unnamed protein product, partial [Nesidiocoris tenuis]